MHNPCSHCLHATWLYCNVPTTETKLYPVLRVIFDNFVFLSKDFLWPFLLPWANNKTHLLNRCRIKVHKIWCGSTLQSILKENFRQIYLCISRTDFCTWCKQLHLIPPLTASLWRKKINNLYVGLGEILLFFFKDH